MLNRSQWLGYLCGLAATGIDIYVGLQPVALIWAKTWLTNVLVLVYIEKLLKISLTLNSLPHSPVF